MQELSMPPRPESQHPALVNPLAAYPQEVVAYLAGFADRHPAASVLACLEALRGLKVLVVGEAILDEYHYCETLGKSGKEPILATRFLNSEQFAGGILAVANNVAAFAGQVTVLTVLGQQDGRPDPSEPFLRASLDPRVATSFLYQEGAPTITKRRFVERYPLQKLFEVYYMKHMDDDGAESAELCARLEATLGDFDVVVVVDYGHGMIGARAVGLLCSGVPFLAVNTQSNADNQGFNTISKYHRADFVSLSEKELRLEARSRSRETRSLMAEVAGKLGCRCLLVTRGREGNLLFDGREAEVLASPNLSSQVVDRVGAGDAVLSVTALCAAMNAPAEVVGFLGNVVGAQAVATVGHRQSLDQEQLAGTIKALLG